MRDEYKYKYIRYCKSQPQSVCMPTRQPFCDMKNSMVGDANSQIFTMKRMIPILLLATFAQTIGTEANVYGEKVKSRTRAQAPQDPCWACLVNEGIDAGVHTV